MLKPSRSPVFGQFGRAGLPAGNRDRDRRRGGGQARGNRHHRLQRAHLCARRHQCRLRHGHEGHGAASPRRASPISAWSRFRNRIVDGASMKASLATSTVMHALVLGLALASFGAPKTLEVMDVESFPVSIVPIDEITQNPAGRQDRASRRDLGADSHRPSRRGAGRRKCWRERSRFEAGRSRQAKPQGSGV